MIHARHALRNVAPAPSLHTYFDVTPESPDGRHVVWFAFDGKPLTQGTVTIGPREGDAPAVNVSHCAGSAHGGAQQGWLDEEHIYFTADGELQIADLHGRIVQRCSGAADTLHQGTRRALAPSVNWRKAGGRPPKEEACYRVDIDSGVVTELLDRDGAWLLVREQMDVTDVPLESMSFKHSKWSPDGSQWFVVFTNESARQGQPGMPNIKVLLAADQYGGNPHLVGSFGHHPQWLPDGSGIYAFAGKASGRLLRWDAAGGKPTVLADLPCEGHPSVHPSGAWVVTDSHQQGEMDAIYLQRLKDGKGETLHEFASPHVDWQKGHPPGRVCHAHPVWSPDGRRLYINTVVGEMPLLQVMEWPTVETSI